MLRRTSASKCNFSSMENYTARKWLNSRGRTLRLPDGPKTSGTVTTLWFQDWLQGITKRECMRCTDVEIGSRCSCWEIRFVSHGHTNKHRTGTCSLGNTVCGRVVFDCGVVRAGFCRQQQDRAGDAGGAGAVADDRLASSLWRECARSGFSLGQLCAGIQTADSSH